MSFLMSLMSVNRPQRVTSQFLGAPSISTINSSTSPRWSLVFFPEMLLANVRRLFLPVLGSKSHIVPRIVTGTLLGGEFRIEAIGKEFLELLRERCF